MKNEIRIEPSTALARTLPQGIPSSGEKGQPFSGLPKILSIDFPENFFQVLR